MLIDRSGSVLTKNTDRTSKVHAIAELICIQGGYRWVGLYDVDFQRGVVSNISWHGTDPPAYLRFSLLEG
jgi:L-methionine (R)-S-oxide reductase